jgi:hypothetical protein
MEKDEIKKIYENYKAEIEAATKDQKNDSMDVAWFFKK